jgi:Undecaprenyl-phosphate galactose phosphotransferase WbaP
MMSVLLLTDIVSLSGSVTAAWWLRRHFYTPHDTVSFGALLVFVLLVMLVFSVLGRYAGVSTSAPEELRSSTLACFLVCLWCAIRLPFLTRDDLAFSWILYVAMGIATVTVPLVRELVRFLLSRSPWWGYPAVLWGQEEVVHHLIRKLKSHSSLGLKPVALICTDTTDKFELDNIPVVEPEELPYYERCLAGQGYAIFAGPAASKKNFLTCIQENRSLFPHVLVVPESWEFSCSWVRPRNLGGLLGLEVREDFQPGKRALKRAIDLVVTSSVLVITGPLFVFLAIAIKLDSRGPVFYGQRRIGLHGKEFTAWKFRSMILNADTALARYFEQYPEMQAEWKRNHKLRHDPRITRVGKFLRKSSLDEIPQLWNILRGEMSLVGPRPIVRDEIPRYGEHFSLYTSVHSGLTGLWQISGRSETSYQQRVDFDAIYVRNWSVWLDLYILFRTIGVLWLRTGAY